MVEVVRDDVEGVFDLGFDAGLVAAVGVRPYLILVNLHLVERRPELHPEVELRLEHLQRERPLALESHLLHLTHEVHSNP